MKKEYILVSKAKVKKIYRLNIEKFKSLLNDAVRNQLIDSYRLETDPEKKEALKQEIEARCAALKTDLQGAVPQETAAAADESAPEVSEPCEEM